MTDQQQARPAELLAPCYVVLRAAPDLPDGYMPDRLEGLWLDLADVPKAPRLPVPAVPGGRAHATGRFETRGDGVRAEVFEVRTS